MDDAVDRIIACSRKDDVTDVDDWTARHRQQSRSGVEVDEVDTGGVGSVCVAYETGLDFDINTPSREAPEVDGLAQKLRHRLLTGTVAGVTPDIKVGCDPIWSDKTELPIYDGELGDSAYYSASTTACIPPEQFLQMQFNIREVQHPSDRGIVDWTSKTSESQIDMFRESIRDRDQEFPRPYIRFDSNGEVALEQEGRHRTLAAIREGVPWMDVFFFYHTKNSRGEPERKFPEPPTVPRSI